MPNASEPAFYWAAATCTVVTADLAAVPPPCMPSAPEAAGEQHEAAPMTTLTTPEPACNETAGRSNANEEAPDKDIWAGCNLPALAASASAHSASGQVEDTGDSAAEDTFVAMVKAMTETKDDTSTPPPYTTSVPSSAWPVPNASEPRASWNAPAPAVEAAGLLVTNAPEALGVESEIPPAVLLAASEPACAGAAEETGAEVEASDNESPAGCCMSAPGADASAHSASGHSEDADDIATAAKAEVAGKGSTSVPTPEPIPVHANGGSTPCASKPAGCWAVAAAGLAAIAPPQMARAPEALGPEWEFAPATVLAAPEPADTKTAETGADVEARDIEAPVGCALPAPADDVSVRSASELVGNARDGAAYMEDASGAAEGHARATVAKTGTKDDISAPTPNAVSAPPNTWPLPNVSELAMHRDAAAPGLAAVARPYVTGAPEAVGAGCGAVPAKTPEALEPVFGDTAEVAGTKVETLEEEALVDNISAPTPDAWAIRNASEPARHRAAAAPALAAAGLVALPPPRITNAPEAAGTECKVPPTAMLAAAAPACDEMAEKAGAEVEASHKEAPMDYSLYAPVAGPFGPMQNAGNSAAEETALGPAAKVEPGLESHGPETKPAPAPAPSRSAMERAGGSVPAAVLVTATLASGSKDTAIASPAVGACAPAIATGVVGFGAGASAGVNASPAAEEAPTPAVTAGRVAAPGVAASAARRGAFQVPLVPPKAAPRTTGATVPDGFVMGLGIGLALASASAAAASRKADRRWLCTMAIVLLHSLLLLVILTNKGVPGWAAS